MARWKLTEPHYLNVLHDEWESKETNQETGRQAIKRYKVPRYLNPESSADFNYKDEGIIVCWPGKGQPKDIEFEGPPTPSMEALDDEAKAISDKERPNWRDPINEFSAQSHEERMLRALQDQMAEIRSEKSPAGSVSRKDFEALQEKVAALMEQNAQLKVGRRI